MFNLFKPFDILTIKSSAYIPYNPLINYDWSTTTASGLRYLKDVGSTPTYNASMYFGRGAYFNGVDQSIIVPINATIQTSLKRVNGVVTINETSQILTNYVISGVGAHKDYYLFTRLLTTAEKDSYINTPELFYAMAQADSTCVLNMPMCETDRYARNMKSYSLGSELPKTVIQERLHNASGTIVTNIGDYKYNVSSSVKYGSCRYGLYNQAYQSNGALVNYLTQGKQYLIEADITVTSGIVDVYLQGFTTQAKYENYTTGTYKHSSISTVSNIYGAGLLFENDVDGSSTWTTSNLSVKEVTGIYPITNYTTSVRDNAKNLQYGLQTCKFVRDSLGVIQSASDYLECNGTGYAIIPSHADTVNINMTVNPTSLSGNLLSGGVTKTLTGLTLNVDNDVVISNVTATGAITLASGFSGTIKTYTEELV